MKILENLLPILFDLIKLFILSACFGFFARILKSIFIRQGREVDKIFAYLYMGIFYIPFIFKGVDFLIKSLKIFFYDINFLQKVLCYILSTGMILISIFCLVKAFSKILELFFICSQSENEEVYSSVANLISGGSYFAISVSVILLTFSFFIGGILKPVFGSGGMILKIFVGFVFIAILLCGIIFFIEYKKRFHSGKKKFLLKSFFLDKNNEKSFFKFIVREAVKENKIIIHYEEKMSERKIGIDFYIDEDTFGKVFYEQTDKIFSTTFFEKNKKLEENKIFKLNFLIPRENIIAFYYKDRYKIYKDKNSLLYSDVELDYYPYLFLTEILNGSEGIKLEFSYLEINEQEFFIEEYGKFTKKVKSFRKMSEFFSNYFGY